MSEQAKILLRLPKTLHTQLKAIAKESELSVNAIIAQACEIYQESYNVPTIQKRLEAIEAKLASTGVAATPSGNAAASSVDAARFEELEKRLSIAENMARNTIRQGCVIGAQLDRLAEHVNFSFQEKSADEEYEEDDEDDESEEAS